MKVKNLKIVRKKGLGLDRLNFFNYVNGGYYLSQKLQLTNYTYLVIKQNKELDGK